MEQQDFDQYDNLEVAPTVEGSMLYIELPENMINAAVDIDVVEEEFNFDAFAEDYFAERVLEGVITYEIENTTSKPISVTIELVDEGGAVLDTEAFNIDPAPTADLRREVTYGPGGKSIDIIKNVSSIRVTATNLGDNTSTSSLPEPMVKLRSAGKFKVQIQ